MCPSENQEEKASSTSSGSETISDAMKRSETIEGDSYSALERDSAGISIVQEEENKEVAAKFENRNIWKRNAISMKENDMVDAPRVDQDQPNDIDSSPHFDPEHRDSIEKTISEIDSSSEGCFPEENISECTAKSNNICHAEGIQTKVRKDVEIEKHDESEIKYGDDERSKVYRIHNHSFDQNHRTNHLSDMNERKDTEKHEQQQQLQNQKYDHQHHQQRVYKQYTETTTVAPQVSSQASVPFSNMEVHSAQQHPMVMLPNQHMGGVMLPHMQAPMHYMHHPHPTPPPVQLPAVYTNGSSFLMDRNSFVDRNPFVSQQHQQVIAPHATPHHQHHQQKQQPFRKRIVLRLVEKQDTGAHNVGKKSFFSMLKRPKSRSMGNSEDISDYSSEVMNSNIEDYRSPQRIKKYVMHGEVTVSWYEGTTAVELQDHVRKSVESKVRLGTNQIMVNFRILDENVEPYEEIVLSPFIPDGSKFLLTFRIKDLSSKGKGPSYHHRAPPSPSAAPSPPGELEQELQRQISEVLQKTGKDRIPTKLSGVSTPKQSQHGLGPNPKDKDATDATDEATRPKSRVSESLSMNDMNKFVPLIHDNDLNDNILATRLEELNASLLRLHNEGPWSKDDPTYKKTEKKQVVFVLANYFVLFLSLIAISAEIHERAPAWIEYINENVTSVQNCAVDRDALFECVSEGNFSGLIASFILWASQSVATKRLFLFGFDSPGKLWTVVYEAGVTALCWGTSYLAIRRGLNPDTRPNCLRKYWKDAVYGSLAGFNAAFMKAVLKNLLPKADEVFDVMEGRQLHLVKQLGKFFKAGSEM